MKVDYTIVQDSREKLGLFNKSIIEKLDVGDYSINGYQDRISIERKGMGDLFSTLSSGHARFNREIERSKSLDYFAIIIEGTITDCMLKKFNYSYKTKMKGYVIFSILVTLHLKHKIPFFFTQNRAESKRLIKELFNGFVRKNGNPNI